MRIAFVLLLLVGGTAVMIRTTARLAAEDPLAAPPPAFVDRALEGDLAEAFGAAHFLPADCAAFSSLLDVDGWIRDLWNSEALALLRATPGGSRSLLALQQAPQMQQLQAFLAQPLGQQVQAALTQLVDEEIFVAFGSDAPARIQAAIDVYNAVALAGMVADMRTDGPPFAIVQGPLIEAVLARRELLKVPSLLIGAQLRDPAALRQLIDQFLPMAAGALPPGLYQAPDVQAPWSHRFIISAQDLLAAQRGTMQMELVAGGIPDEQATILLDWLSEQTLHLTLTIRDDYLLVHLGADDAFLAQWAQGPSLAASAPFLPLRALHRPGLLNVGYQNAATTALIEWGPGTVRDFTAQVSARIDELPLDPAMLQRLRTDLPALGERLAASLPEPGSAVSCTFREQGLHSYTIREGPDRRGGNADLHLRRLGGPAPLLLAVASDTVAHADFALLADGVALLSGYLADFTLATLPDEERAMAAEALAAVRDFGTSLRAIAAGDLRLAFPDRILSAVIVESGGNLVDLPEQTGLADGLAVPRVALAVEIADADALRRAVQATVNAVEALGQRLALLPGSEIPHDLAFPRPLVEARGDQTWYRYPSPLGGDAEPTAVLTADLLLVGSSHGHLGELLGRRALPPVADPPALAQVDLDVAAWARYLLEAGRAVHAGVMRAERGGPRGMHPEEALVLAHAEALVQALQGIERWQLREERRDTVTLSESWLRVRP